ncbi:MAG: sugar phosphate isomerase/epimerase [bacterium]|nr:sugar phosphate isomerase/epimerase [bacterium]
MSENSVPRRDFLKQTAAVAAGVGVLSAMRGADAAEGPYPALPLGVTMGMLPKLPDEEKFVLAKRCGLQGVEGRPIADHAAAKKQAEVARAAGCPIHSICFGGWDKPLSHPNEAVQAEGVHLLKDAVHCAKAMGVDNILLVPAVVNAGTRYVEAYDRSQANIRKVLPLAEEKKVVIAVENVWNDFLLSPREFAQYVDEFESPYLKAYFDTGNVVKYGWAEDWIHTLGSRINRVHLKDYTRGEGGKWRDLREGDVNWPEVRKALDEVGYEGFCTAELRGGDEAYLTELVKTMTLCVTGQ